MTIDSTRISAGKRLLMCLGAMLVASVVVSCPALAAQTTNRVLVVYDDEAPSTSFPSLSVQSEDDAMDGVVSIESAPIAADKSERVEIATLEEGESAEAAAARLGRMPGVAYAQPDYAYEPAASGGIFALRQKLSPTEELFGLASSSYMYPTALRRSGFETAWATLDIMSALNAPSEVAVVDTGCQMDHPDLRNVVDSANAYDAVKKTNQVHDMGVEQFAGHGTHVCGIVGAQANNGGVAGAAWATPGGTKVLPINVFGDNNVAYTSSIVNALLYIDDLVTSGKVSGLHVVNMSLGSKGAENKLLHQAIQRLRGHGILCVCAAGNDNSPDDYYPADYDECLSVMALDRGGSRLVREDNFGSNYGPKKDISAVGEYFYSSIPTSNYGYKTGTSMASPVVAGAAALLWKADPDLSVDLAVSALVSTTSRVSSGVAGELNVAAAIQRVAEFAPSDLVSVGDVEPRVDIRYGNIRPEPTVTLGKATLVNGRDYKLSYTYTTSASGEITEGPAACVVTGLARSAGGFGGSVTVPFTVTNDFRDAIVEAQDTQYTGHAAAPQVTLSVTNTGERTTLTQGVDFEVESSAINAGSATCSVVGKGTYTGRIDNVPFTIKPVDITNGQVIANDTKFTGDYAKPGVFVILPNGAAITNQDDFIVQTTGINAGKQVCTVTGRGPNVYGVKMDVPFEINAAQLSEVDFHVDPQTYTGKKLRPTPAYATYNGITLDPSSYRVYQSESGYGDNVNVADGGTITMESTSNNFTGYAKVHFDITPIDLSTARTELKALDTTYTGYAAQPGVAVVVGESTILSQGTDYTVSSDAKDVGEGTATVSGRGNYTGSQQTTFAIKPASITAARISIENQTFKGRAITPQINATWLRHTLELGRDFRVSAWRDNSKPGTAFVDIQGINNFEGSATGRFQIQSEETAVAGTTTTKWNFSISSQPMYRLYNENSGEHFYTRSAPERNALRDLGWKYEGVGWNAPLTSKNPVHRLYNPHTGDHHYTMSSGERDALVIQGWKSEGIGWYSDNAKTVPLWREYNPNATTGSHNYTTSASEHASLCSMGWKDEGIGWYGM